MLDALIADMRETAAERLSQGPISLGYRLGHIQADGRVFRGVVYNKSAVVLHMLRRLIGDEAFFNGLRKFYRDSRFKKAGTGDFRAAFEAVSPLKLERFFDRWILGSTVPRLRLSHQPGSEPGTVVIRVEQVGDAFDLPLTVSVQYTDGRSEDLTLKITADCRGADDRSVAVCKVDDPRRPQLTKSAESCGRIGVSEGRDSSSCLRLPGLIASRVAAC